MIETSNLADSVSLLGLLLTLGPQLTPNTGALFTTRYGGFSIYLYKLRSPPTIAHSVCLRYLSFLLYHTCSFLYHRNARSITEYLTKVLGMRLCLHPLLLGLRCLNYEGGEQLQSLFVIFIKHISFRRIRFRCHI